MKIGIIGSGTVGRSVGTGFINLGDEVKIGTRNPDKQEIKEWKEKNGRKLHQVHLMKLLLLVG